jgi:hypothetical protein
MLASPVGVRKWSEQGVPSAFMVHRFFEKSLMPDIDREDAELFVKTALIESPLFVASWFNEQAGKKADAPIDNYARSMAAGGNIMSAVYAPERYGITELQAPAGINDLTRDVPRWRRIGSFAGSMVHNAMKPEQNILKDSKNYKGGLEIIGRMATDVKERHFVTKVGLAVTMDSGPNIVTLHNLKGEDFTIWLGSEDVVVPPEHVYRVIGRALLENGQSEDVVEDFVRVFPGSHTGLYANASRLEIERISEHLKQRRQARQKTGLVS